LVTKSRRCPVCFDSNKNSVIFQNENIDKKKITSFTYASRKNPEFMCHEMVRCLNCDLVYVTAPPDKLKLSEAYHTADYDSSEEALDAAETYINHINEVVSKLNSKSKILEIGSGSGDFLYNLKKKGFANLTGIEPSISAINSAHPEIKSHLQEGIFQVDNFQEMKYDLVCCFMTLEHVYDPREISESVNKILKKGGYFVMVVHNYRSLVNRILGRKSPIIDIEHMQLFSKKSIGLLFNKTNYQDIQIKDFYNHYPIKYWIRLSPIPNLIKNIFIKLLHKFNLGNFKIKINVGNIMVSGRKVGGVKKPNTLNE
jgi:SAM-dependent methyltransferase